MDALEIALPMAKTGGGFVGYGVGWSMTSEKIGKAMTGKIIVVCQDPEALAEFIKRASVDGHTAEFTDRADTILIKPKFME
jgi:hypothetical protein